MSGYNTHFGSKAQPHESAHSPSIPRNYRPIFSATLSGADARLNRAPSPAV
jgi:hypothetical protein